MAQTGLNYSDYAIALKWEIINDEPDIGKWEMFFEEDNSIKNGKGMSDLLEMLLQLNQEQINVIYVKDLNYFEVIGENYFSYSSEFMAAVKDGQINFFNLKLFDWIELVNWNNFFDTEDCEEFIRELNLCRSNFKGQNKNKLSLKSHYRITKAADQWFDITERFYLKKEWTNIFRDSLLPQDQDELNLFLEIYKGSYSFLNPKFVGKTIENVKGYDISSSHSGFILRKKYPSSTGERITDVKEIYNIINEDWYAWIGRIEFVDLYEKFELPIDLRQFGYINENDNWELILTNAHWKVFKRLFGAKTIIPIEFYKYENKELARNYAKMVNDLYEEKEFYKKSNDSFVKGIFKFRTELPFGQSIKAPQFHQAVIYNEETNQFEKFKLTDQPFEEIIGRLKKYALPMQIGIWTAAYSWAEEVNMILDLGVENVVYGDTDCVRFIGDLDYVIEAHNKEIDKEVNNISKKRIMLETNTKLGRWQDEGTFSQFKAIGIKWYLFIDNDKLEVKAAGANKDKLLKWLNEQDNPFEEFNKEMYVPQLFKNMSINREKGTVYLSYNNYMGDKLKREISQKTNGFVI